VQNTVPGSLGTRDGDVSGLAYIGIVLVLKGSSGQEGQYGVWKCGIVQTLGMEPPIGIKRDLSETMPAE
jgi:hypothetical protein